MKKFEQEEINEDFMQEFEDLKADNISTGNDLKCGRTLEEVNEFYSNC